MKYKYLKISIALFFSLILCVYVLTLFFFARHWHGWIIGDWLLNYQEGFIRRGLSGYLMINLSQLFNTPLNFTVMWIQVGIYLAYMGVLLFILKNKKITFWYLLLLVSPVTLLFPVLEPETAGRKEIILFLIFGLYTLCLKHELLKSDFKLFLFSISLFIATLFHELVFFYIPYFILAAYLNSRLKNEPFGFYKSILVISGSVIAFALLFIFGQPINGPALCNGLLQKGLPDNICQGILSFPPDFGISELFEHANENQYLRNFSISLLMASIPFFIFIRFSKDYFFTLKNFILVMGSLFLFSLPLFFLGIDWGRWINIHFMLILFASTILLVDMPTEYSKILNNEKMELPKFLRLVVINRIVILLFVLMYSTLWYMGNSTLFSVFSCKIYSKISIFLSYIP